MPTDLAALRAKLAAQRVMEVEQPRIVQDIPLPTITPVPEPHEPHVITEDSPVITELEESERPDSDFVVIGGQTIAKDNPIFAKLNIIWENEADSQMADTVKLTITERVQMLEPTELAQLILNKELASEFGIPNLSLYREVFNNEVMKVKDMSLSEIDARIQKHHTLIEQINILIQADVTVKIEKKKRDKQEVNKTGDEDYKRKKQEAFKRRLAARPVKSSASEEEKLIQKLINSGMTRANAEALVKEE